jgi:hypothetical protein
MVFIAAFPGSHPHLINPFSSQFRGQCTPFLRGLGRSLP